MIRELRKMRNYTQEELAAELNISYEHLNKIERGKNGCSFDILIDLSGMFEVSIDYLLTGRDFNNLVTKKRLEKVADEINTILREMA